MNQREDDTNLCNDDNIKVIEVEFDTGSLNKKYFFRLCEHCNGLKAYQKFRLGERKI